MLPCQFHYEYKRLLSKKVDPLAFRLDPDVRAAPDNDAAEQERSLSWVINRILREHYKLPKPARPKQNKGNSPPIDDYGIPV